MVKHGLEPDHPTLVPHTDTHNRCRLGVFQPVTRSFVADPAESQRTANYRTGHGTGHGNWHGAFAYT